MLQRQDSSIIPLSAVIVDRWVNLLTHIISGQFILHRSRPDRKSLSKCWGFFMHRSFMGQAGVGWEANEICRFADHENKEIPGGWN